jgi:hypothetical protein
VVIRRTVLFSGLEFFVWGFLGTGLPLRAVGVLFDDCAVYSFSGTGQLCKRHNWFCCFSRVRA